MPKERTARRKLTDRQSSILKFIRRTIRNTGRPPAYKQIAEHFGIKSLNGVRDHLLALQRKGFLNLVGVGRSIEFHSRDLNDLTTIPEVFRVPRIKKQRSLEFLTRHISLRSYFDIKQNGRGDLVAMISDSHGMMGDGIQSHDALIIRLNERFEEGETALVEIKGDLYVRKISSIQDMTVLEVKNPGGLGMPRVTYPKEQVLYVGRVIGLMRTM